MSNLFTNVIMKKADYYLEFDFIDEPVGVMTLFSCQRIDVCRIVQVLAVVNAFNILRISVNGGPLHEFTLKRLFEQGFDLTSLPYEG